MIVSQAMEMPLSPEEKQAKALAAISTDAVGYVKQLILERGGRNGVRTLRRMFKRYDTEGGRGLSLPELNDALLSYGVRMPGPELQKVFHFFDKSGDGSISFHEFIGALRGHMGMRRQEIVRLAFRKLDKDNSGAVTLRELASKYDASQDERVMAGQMSEDDVIREFCNQWDVSGDGIITFEEFKEYYADLGASIEDDDFFELMVRNAWHVSGGSGWCANTTNKRALVTHHDGTQTVEMIELDDDLYGYKGGAVPPKVHSLLLNSRGINAISISFV